MKDIIKEKYGEKRPIIKCLNHGFVDLLDCMPRCIEDAEDSADYVIAEAARCSYQRGTKTIKDDKTLIRYLMRHDHTSPFEMIEFKFKMKLPIFVARQMVRTRTANLNELSGRYSEMPEEYYLPDRLRSQSKINTQGSEGELDKIDSDFNIELMNSHAQEDFDFYHSLLEKKTVREQARVVLPLSTYTEWYWKIDLKNLLHFLNLRCDSHAQKEIQDYANAILELITPIVPWAIEAWEDYSPYRGGMLLTRYEVNAIRSFIQEERSRHCSYDTNASDWYDNENSSKLEKKEWIDKANKLGFIINNIIDVEEGTYQRFTEFPEFCNQYPCCLQKDYKRKLFPDKNGFWICPICKGSYGRKYNE